ncbi:MAG: clostripain-related cysteine peptidase [bacterium]
MASKSGIAGVPKRRRMKIKSAGGWLRAIPLLVCVSIVMGAQWTVGVYMAADNGMSEQAAVDIAEMLKVGSTEEVKIVVQVDNASRDTNPNCRRYLVLKDSLRLLADLGEVDMADTATLTDFLDFLGSRFQARNYFLIIWDHGDGWRKGYGPQRAVVIDESHGHMMGVAGGELHRALASGKKKMGRNLTILGFDACLMGSIEVATEVMSFADFLLASEAVVPWDGFPYDAFLGRLVARPTATPAEFLPEMCSDYVASFPGEDVCLSAVDLKQLRRVLAVARNVVGDSVDPGVPGFRLARRGVQTFPASAVNPPGFLDEQVDFIHFWQLAPGGEILRSVLNPLVVANAVSGSYGSARGISVWFPARYVDFKGRSAEYRELAFADSVPWLRFLNNYYSRDDVKPSRPEIVTHRSGGRGDVRLWWQQVFDLSPVVFELYQADEPGTVFLERGDSLGNWNSEGWTVSTRYFRSPPTSFFSGSASNLDSRLTLQQPLTLAGGGLLSFYAFYWSEESEDSAGNISRDVCYLERSDAGGNWFLIDSLYGRADTWREYRYILPAGTNYLRFRYRTDEEENRLGVFVDDIRVERFSYLRLVTVTPETTAYLFNLARDTSGYTFSVVAVDSFGNRSMSSQLYTVKISSWAEPYTMPAPFSGSCKLVFDFPEKETVDVFIYTIAGTLVKRFSRVVSRVVEWDGKNEAGRELAEGVYLVVLKGRRFKKMGKVARAGVFAR